MASAAATHCREPAEGALPLVVLELLRELPIKRQCQREGWLALQSLLAVRPAEAVASALREAGAISLVLTTLKVHEDHADVQASAIGFVWKLAFCDQGARAAMLADGVIPLILKGVALHALEPSACALTTATAASTERGTAGGAGGFASTLPGAGASSSGGGTGLARSGASTQPASGAGRHTTLIAQLILYNTCGALRTLLGAQAHELTAGWHLPAVAPAPAGLMPHGNQQGSPPPRGSADPRPSTPVGATSPTSSSGALRRPGSRTSSRPVTPTALSPPASRSLLPLAGAHAGAMDGGAGQASDGDGGAGASSVPALDILSLGDGDAHGGGGGGSAVASVEPGNDGAGGGMSVSVLSGVDSEARLHASGSTGGLAGSRSSGGLRKAGSKSGGKSVGITLPPIAGALAKPRAAVTKAAAPSAGAAGGHASPVEDHPPRQAAAVARPLADHSHSPATAPPPQQPQPKRASATAEGAGNGAHAADAPGVKQQQQQQQQRLAIGAQAIVLTCRVMRLFSNESIAQEQAIASLRTLALNSTWRARSCTPAGARGGAAHSVVTRPSSAMRRAHATVPIPCPTARNRRSLQIRRSAQCSSGRMLSRSSRLQCRRMQCRVACS
jgi:hypothetical protein